jgi:hypothetical protein
MSAELDGEQIFDGYIKELGEEMRILVRPDAWRRLWAGLDADLVKQYPQRARLLIDRNGDVPSPEKIGGKTGRFYVLASAFVEQA